MRFGVAAVVFLLSACATARYVEPTGAGLATLVIENSGSDPMEAVTFDDAAACEGRRLMHPGIREGGPLIVRVRGGAPFTLWAESTRLFSSRGEVVGRIAGGVTCGGAITFVPVAGRRYVAHFSMQPDNERKQVEKRNPCHVQLLSEVRDPNGDALRTRLAVDRREAACAAR